MDLVINHDMDPGVLLDGRKHMNTTLPFHLVASTLGSNPSYDQRFRASVLKEMADKNRNDCYVAAGVFSAMCPASANISTGPSTGIYVI